MCFATQNKAYKSYEPFGTTSRLTSSQMKKPKQIFNIKWSITNCIMSVDFIQIGFKNFDLWCT